jgi:hypothetical protein
LRSLLLHLHLYKFIWNVVNTHETTLCHNPEDHCETTLCPNPEDHCETILCHNPEDHCLNCHCCENHNMWNMFILPCKVPCFIVFQNKCQKNPFIYEYLFLFLL